MSDFITLNCPSCGGKLNVQKESPTYICDYCGTEHKLREEDIESFGRCPKCHRNDRVEKITAITNKHDPLAVKFPSPDQLNLDRYVGRPDLALQQKLDSLLKQQIPGNVNKKRSTYFFIGMAVLFFQFLCGGSVSGTENHVNSGLLLLLGSFVLAGFGVFYMKRGERFDREFEMEVLGKRSVLEQELTYKRREIKSQMSNLRRKLTSRYDKIYYCHRDDLLFIPGEAGYASCNDYEGFLTHVLKTNKKA